jgi:hypothetical protein
MQMELSPNSHVPDGLLAAMTLLSEKPHQGVPSWESAPHQGIDERNCTALLGLRFRSSEIVSGTVVAPSNLMNVSLTKPCSASGAFSLDYSQPLFNGGTQTSQQHIMQRHGGSGLPGVSQYFGNFSQIQNINSMTYLFGSQLAQGNSVVFQYTFPQLLSPFAVTHIGTDPSGNHTSTNRLVTQSNCKTVVTSYPIPD